MFFQHQSAVEKRRAPGGRAEAISYLVSLWLAYGLMIAAPPMDVANAIGFVISLALLGMKIRFRGN
jgi:hypothetical protein